MAFSNHIRNINNLIYSRHSRESGNHEHLAPSILKLKQNRNILNLYALQPAWILATRAYILRFLNHLPFDTLRANDPHNTFALSCEPAEQSKGILTIHPQTPAATAIFSVHPAKRFCVGKVFLGVGFL